MLRTVIFPFVLCGCETWSVAVQEEYRLRVFEGGWIGSYVGLGGREEVTGELQMLYCSPDITGVVKSRKVRRVRHVARMSFGKETGRKER